MNFKCLVLFACLSFTYLVSAAQIKKGATILGGGVSYSSLKNDVYLPRVVPQYGRDVTISPGYGRAIKDNLIVGINLTASWSKAEFIPSTTNSEKENQYGIGLFVRQYQMLWRRFSVFVEGDIDVSQGEKLERLTFETVLTKGPSYSLSFYPGLSYSLNKRLQIETRAGSVLGLSYFVDRRTKRDNDNKIIEQSRLKWLSSEVSLQNALGFGVGFRLLLNEKFN